jgi:hypothetical protein
MMASRASILFLVAGALGGCVSDAQGGDPDLDPSADPEARRRPRPQPEPDPDPTPGEACALIGGPSTLGATMGAIDYQVTGGPNGTGNGTSLHITEEGWVTLRTAERGIEQGWLEVHAHYGLFRKSTSADLPTLCAMYSCAGCTGDFVHNLSVSYNDIPYTARASFRAIPPERLIVLIDAVRSIIAAPPLN